MASKKPKHHAYTVTWRDSTTSRGWRGIDDPALDGVALITSIGWVVRETPHTITITTCISEHGNVRDALTIPREVVVRMKRLPYHVVNES